MPERHKIKSRPQRLQEESSSSQTIDEIQQAYKDLEEHGRLEFRYANLSDNSIK